MKALKVFIFIIAIFAIKGEEIQFEDGVAPLVVLKIINAAAKAYMKLAQTFKTSISKTFKEMLIGEGFDKYSGKVINHIYSIKPGKYSRFIKRNYEKLNIPEKLKDVILATFDEATYMDKQAWMGFDLAFNSESSDPDKVDFANVMVTQNEEEDAFDIIFSYTKADFKLAPDIIVFSEKKVIGGGISVTEKDVYKEVPRSLTEDDLNCVLSFFQMAAYRAIIQSLGKNIQDFIPAGTDDFKSLK